MPKGPRLAKLSRPRLRHTVVRQRLFGIIDSVCAQSLLWLAAPPGAGKTTLVASYLEARERPVLWYQVDAGDADPAAFFYYLGLAVSPGRGGESVLPQFLPEHASDLPGFTRHFFRQLFSVVAPETVLVLDNFQEAADAGLAALLHGAHGEIPPGVTVLIISRAEPPPSYAELAARDALSVVGWDDIRLTLDETRAMAGARGMAEDWVVQALHQHADGWAAGITLMLERLKRVGSGVGSLPTDSRESVFNYFASLVFEQGSESTRRTLVSLAFLPRVTPTLARTLSGNPDAGRVLDGLHHRNLFTDCRPGAEPVYQFHALFQSFLQAKATETLHADDLQRTMRDAGMALTENGEWEAAHAVLVQAGCWADAIELVLGRAADLLETGRWQTLSSWITAVPETPRKQTPWLDYWQARATAQTDPAAAIDAFERVHRRFAEAGSHTGEVLSLTGLLNACAVDHVDYRTIDRWLDTLAALLQAGSGALTQADELGAWAAFVVGAAYVRPRHEAIATGIATIERLLKSTDPGGAALAALTGAFNVSSMVSEMDRCERLTGPMLAMARASNVSPAASGWALFAASHQRFLVGDYERALELFDEIWEMAHRHGLRRALRSSMMHRFAVEFRILDLPDVATAMARIEALPRLEAPISRALLLCYRARFAQCQGRWDLAADLAEACDTAILESGAAHHEMIYGLINGEILMSAGRVARARELLSRSRSIIDQAPRLDAYRPALLLTEAWLADLEGRIEDSHARLRESLKLSPLRFGWCQMRYVDSSATHMLRVALAHDIETDEARRLIRLFRLRAQETDADTWPWPLKVITLGRFEVLSNDRPLDFGHKTPKKALALLKALVAFGPRGVPEQQIVDALWPDEEGDAGHKALSVTLLRLRRLLDDNALVRLQGGRLSLDRQRCWVDAWSFEQQLARCAPNGVRTGSDAGAFVRTLSAYGGTFLPDDSEETWSAPTRERLRAKYIHALGYVGQHLEERDGHSEAIVWYQRGLDADPLVEAFYQGLIRCYGRLDRRTEGIAAYRRLRQMLSITLGLRPTELTERLYASLRADADS